MNWNTIPGATRLIGYLALYGCKTGALRTEEELLCLASEIFRVTNTGSADSIADEIKRRFTQQHGRKKANVAIIYNQVDRLWPQISSFWNPKKIKAMAGEDFMWTSALAQYSEQLRSPW